MAPANTSRFGSGNLWACGPLCRIVVGSRRGGGGPRRMGGRTGEGSMKGVLVEGRPAGSDPLAADEPPSSRGLSSPPPRAAAEPPPPGEVLAVIVERTDGTCAFYGQGRRGEWPSMSAALDALARVTPTSEWRQSTPGVWVARAGDGERVPTGGSRSTRPASHPRRSPPAGPSPTSDSYSAARIIRGVGTKG
jgi:hypothetical protein